MCKNRKQNLLGVVTVLCFAVCAFCSCEKTISLYSGDNYIYFTKDAQKDSIVYNFGYHGTPKTDRIGVEVSITGDVMNVDREYKVKIGESSQLKENTHFKIDKNALKIAAGKITDTLWLDITNASDLRQSQKSIVLELESNEQFAVIFAEKTVAKIYLSDVILQPIWWNDWHLEQGLGEYSEAKYREFIKITKQYNLSEDIMSFENRRNYLLQFKYYLMEMNDNGTPVMDGDKPMSVMIYG